MTPATRWALASTSFTLLSGGLVVASSLPLGAPTDLGLAIAGLVSLGASVGCIAACLRSTTA